MGLTIATVISAPLENNTYILYDPRTKQAAVIDPSFETDKIIKILENEHLSLAYILNTHAHFDHIAGVSRLTKQLGGNVEIALHADDLPLWNREGAAPYFGYHIEVDLPATMELFDGQIISIGESRLETRHTPGHSPGHVIFYAKDEATCFCGDVIFRGSIGRTDLPGGDHAKLLESIRSRVLTLPGNTMLLSGHGPATTVAKEIRDNPFLA